MIVLLLLVFLSGTNARPNMFFSPVGPFHNSRGEMDIVFDLGSPPAPNKIELEGLMPSAKKLMVNALNGVLVIPTCNSPRKDYSDCTTPATDSPDLYLDAYAIAGSRYETNATFLMNWIDSSPIACQQVAEGRRAFFPNFGPKDYLTVGPLYVGLEGSTLEDNVASSIQGLLLQYCSLKVISETVVESTLTRLNEATEAYSLFAETVQNQTVPTDPTSGGRKRRSAEESHHREKRFIWSAFNHHRIDIFEDDIAENKAQVAELVDISKTQNKLIATNANSISKLTNTTLETVKNLTVFFLDKIGVLRDSFLEYARVNDVYVATTRRLRIIQEAHNALARLVQSVLQEEAVFLELQVEAVSETERFTEAVQYIQQRQVPPSIITPSMIRSSMNDPILLAYLSGYDMAPPNSDDELKLVYSTASAIPLYASETGHLYLTIRIPTFRDADAMELYRYTCVPMQIPPVTDGSAALLDCPEPSKGFVALTKARDRYIWLNSADDDCYIAPTSYCERSQTELTIPAGPQNIKECTVSALKVSLGTPMDMTSCETLWKGENVGVHVSHLHNGSLTFSSLQAGGEIRCQNSVEVTKVPAAPLAIIDLPVGCYLEAGGTITRSPLYAARVVSSVKITRPSATAPLIGVQMRIAGHRRSLQEVEATENNLKLLEDPARLLALQQASELDLTVPGGLVSGLTKLALENKANAEAAKKFQEDANRRLDIAAATDRVANSAFVIAITIIVLLGIMALVALVIYCVYGKKARLLMNTAPQLASVVATQPSVSKGQPYRPQQAQNDYYEMR